MKTLALGLLAFVALASVSEGGIIFRNRSCGFGSCGSAAIASEVYVERSRVVTGTAIASPALGFGSRCSVINGRMFCR